MIQTEIGELTDRQKYREPNETFDEKVNRLSAGLMDDDDHRKQLKNILGELRFLPAGRVQAAIGSARKTTAFNCYVSGTIKDDFDDIMDKVKEAGQTMRKGGGIGYDFSTLRPRGDRITSLNTTASGPISFMGLYDAACATVISAGHRRGAQMGVLRIDHPDIEEFISAKNNSTHLTNFNISIGVTDKFMAALADDADFDLVFEGRVYKTVSATALWDKVMRSTWDWAEPGVLFLDTINQKNNLWYMETIAATNPCAEQPLPPYGACLLGSFNLTKYIHGSWDEHGRAEGYRFDWSLFERDIPIVVRAMDNVIDRTIYPLKAQEDEAKNKRRMGLGVTGLANACEIMGFPYASHGMKVLSASILETLRDEAYRASVELAKEKGPFPALEKDLYTEGRFIGTLPNDIQSSIREFGIRNSHLLSIAPTGTISLVADNISGGIEPPFALESERDFLFEEGKVTYRIEDYAKKFYGVSGKTSDEISAADHVAVLNMASYYVDSACSKTCNIGEHVTFDEFKDVYMMAWKGGASGCTTYRAAGKRSGMMRKVEEEKDGNLTTEGAACYIDPLTGVKECA
jgi:ribonucleoside-diphosphate reductase alpha chain